MAPKLSSHRFGFFCFQRHMLELIKYVEVAVSARYFGKQ